MLVLIITNMENFRNGPLFCCFLQKTAVVDLQGFLDDWRSTTFFTLGRCDALPLFQNSYQKKYRHCFETNPCLLQLACQLVNH